MIEIFSFNSTYLKRLQTTKVFFDIFSYSAPKHAI